MSQKRRTLILAPHIKCEQRKQVRGRSELSHFQSNRVSSASAASMTFLEEAPSDLSGSSALLTADEILSILVCTSAGRDLCSSGLEETFVNVKLIQD